jgi:protease-4
MSETQREQLEAWQGRLFESLVATVAEGRGVSEARVRAWIDEALHPARAALEIGMLDGLCYADELEAKARPAEGGTGRPRVRVVRHVDAERYLALDVRAWEGARSPAGPAPDVAYWVLAGSIGRAGRSGVALDAFETLAESLRIDDDVRAVVLRVDSPGGDALVSDLMHRAVTRLREEKPVVASFADVAASGGYYLATAADQILAEAGSLTGSIGVVGAKVDLSRLYARLGIVKESVAHGARSGLFSEASGMGAPERRALRRELGEIYDIFLRRVADGRGLDPAEVERVAEGRVWSGAAARELGLVDGLGGPLEALASARRRAGLAAFEHPRLRVLPRPPPWGRPMSLVPGL